MVDLDWTRLEGREVEDVSIFWFRVVLEMLSILLVSFKLKLLIANFKLDGYGLKRYRRHSDVMEPWNGTSARD